MSGSTKNMILTRLFKAPVEQVWNAWRDPEQVKQWWGPNGFTCPVAEIDFREGGRSLVCMRAPAEFGGQDLYNTWTYARIVPMQTIEFIQHFTDADGNRIEPASIGLPPDIPAEVPHVLVFRPLDAGQTDFTVTEYGYESDQTVEMSRMGMAQCLDKMAAVIEPSSFIHPGGYAVE
jgi:uncharacterized protein YndB with AHSA1/START domain